MYVLPLCIFHIQFIFNDEQTKEEHYVIIVQLYVHNFLMNNNGELNHIFNICLSIKKTDLEDLEIYLIEDIFLEILEVYHWFEKKIHLTILSKTWQN